MDAVGKRRLHIERFFPREYLNAFNAVLPSSFKELLKLRELVRALTYDERAVSSERDIELLGKLRHHTVSLHIELSLQRTGLRVKSCMHYRAVCLACSLADIAFPVDDQN